MEVVFWKEENGLSRHPHEFGELPIATNGQGIQAQ
jgi:hypothetical protein